MEPKIFAMIPVRLGSTRVPKKNLRYLGGYQLPTWAINACKKSDCFNQIWLNSEAFVFNAMAMSEKIYFYNRPKELATSEATNDEFAFDFIEKIPCDVLVQVNSTSPFITAEDIKSFMEYFYAGNYDTLHTVKREQIEIVYKGKPLNFDKFDEMKPSQELEPALVYTSSIMAWKTDIYKQAMRDYGSAVHGPIGITGYFELNGISTIDIDTEEDFTFAEQLVKGLNL